MKLSHLAVQVLRDHAQRPRDVYYDLDVLGSMFRDADVDRLDRAYTELQAMGLMEPSGAVVSFSGEPKQLLKLTKRGMDLVQSQPAA
jgi:hypothetical protein